MRDLIRKNKGFALAGLLIAIFVVAALMLPYLVPDSMGAGAIAARKHWKQKWAYFDGTAGDTISLGDALSLRRGTGSVILANAATGASTYVIGLAGNTAAKGASVQVVTKGILGGNKVEADPGTGLTPYGAPVFLDDTSGGVTVYGGMNGWSAGTTVFVGWVLPRSDYAVDSGVTSGSDTIMVNIPTSTGVSPIFLD